MNAHTLAYFATYGEVFGIVLLTCGLVNNTEHNALTNCQHYKKETRHILVLSELHGMDRTVCDRSRISLDYHIRTLRRCMKNSSYCSLDAFDYEHIRRNDHTIKILNKNFCVLKFWPTLVHTCSPIQFMQIKTM